MMRRETDGRRNLAAGLGCSAAGIRVVPRFNVPISKYKNLGIYH